MSAEMTEENGKASARDSSEANQLQPDSQSCDANLPVVQSFGQDEFGFIWNQLWHSVQLSRYCDANNEEMSLFKIAFRHLSPVRFRVFFSSLTNHLILKNREIAQLFNQCSAEKNKVKQLSKEKSELERKLTEADELLQKTSKELEDERALRKSDAALSEEKLRKHDDAAKRAIQQFQADVNAKLLESSKQVEEIRKERENAVMRFAQAEQQVIDSKALAEQCKESARLAVKERDFFQERIKMLMDEKKKVQAFIDQKTLEVSQLQKEARDAKELAKEAEQKLKLAQAKAKAESDAQQEIRLKFERVQQQLIETKLELERTKQDLNDKEQRHKTDREQESARKEQESIQQRMELAEINERLRVELDMLKQKHRECLDEDMTLKDRVTCLCSELEERNQELALIRNEVLSLKEDALTAREDATAARDRAVELIDHNQQLSLFRSHIQAETSGLRENLSDLQRDFAAITEENNRLKMETSTLMAQLAEERRENLTQSEQLTCELHALHTSTDELRQRLTEQESLFLSSRRKHAREVKELQRQLRGQQLHQSSDQPVVEVNSKSHGLSRTSSNNSDLDKQQNQHSSSSASLKSSTQTQSQQFSSMLVDLPANSNGEVAVVGGGSVEVSRHQIIEKMMVLQRNLAKKSERLDFLNEQVRCLTDEVQKKSRIIQVLATRETAESGAFLSDDMDKHKASMAKRAGIMASVLSSELHDGKMTLDLSLEITRKLQEVLEETLLKNIMLKESLDTLGHEISHLSKENRDLKLTLKGLMEEIPGTTKK